jgi:8-oxo-dGTP diphosphatase
MRKKPAHPIPVVRLIIPDDKGQVLLLQRAVTEFCPDMWCLPGGLVDYGETAEAAAGRELREECRLELIAVKFLFYQDSLPAKNGEMHGINLYFECRTGGNLKLNAESSEHAWVSRSQLENYDLAFKNKEGLYRYFNEFC